MNPCQFNFRPSPRPLRPPQFQSPAVNENITDCFAAHQARYPSSPSHTSQSHCRSNPPVALTQTVSCPSVFRSLPVLPCHSPNPHMPECQPNLLLPPHSPYSLGFYSVAQSLLSLHSLAIHFLTLSPDPLIPHPTKFSPLLEHNLSPNLLPLKFYEKTGEEKILGFTLILP